MANTASETLGNLNTAASETVSSAIEGLSKGAETQKNAGADALAELARSVKASAKGLEDQSPQIARAVQASADTVERVSHDLKTKSVNELLDATTDFARRQPYMFLGLGVLAGIVLARAFANSR